MKTVRIFQVLGIILLGVCSLTHYISLDQEKETDISVSSNVPAAVWMNGREIQPTAKEHILKQAGMGVITLKASGYYDARIIVYRNQPEEKSVISRASSVVWTTQESSDITSNLSELGADAATTSPTSTVNLFYNFGKFIVDLVALPFTSTTEFNPFGYYLAYDKNQFYVEMMPLNASKATRFDAVKMQVKKFVLKNYTELAKGNREYIAALVEFSGLTQGDVLSVLSSVATPAEAADAVAARLTAAHVE